MTKNKMKNKKKNIKEIKMDKDIALAKIKVNINKYFEDVGREIFEDIDLARIDLIDEIDDILDKTEISPKDLIIEKFNIEFKKDKNKR